MKKIFPNLLVILFLNAALSYSQTDDLMPGVDRWEVKTSAANLNEKPKFVPLKDLLHLPLLASEYSSSAYPDTFIPAEIGSNLHEGQIVYTTGYLHLVALERDSKTHKDGDFHIQITAHPYWSDSCFIVEVPFEDFVSNKELKKDCEANRKYIRDNILNGKEPTATSSAFDKGIFVKVTGQLFYDAIHATQMGNPDPSKRKYRGKNGGKDKPMHSYTAWEIHPVSAIEKISETDEIAATDSNDNSAEFISSMPKNNPPSNQNTNKMENTAFNTLIVILLGAILGMVGQGMRVVVGIKKLQEEISTTGQKDLFQSKQLILSLLIAFAIGSIAGVLAAVGSTDLQFSKTVMFSFIAAGYAGTDFIEGFMQKNPNIIKSAEAPKVNP